MKWLYFIIVVLINSTAVIGITLETKGFTVSQALFISIFFTLLVITVVGFIVIEFTNQHEKREKEFGILIRELREIKEVVGTSETRMILLENLIQNDIRNDVEKVNEIVRQNLIRKA